MNRRQLLAASTATLSLTACSALTQPNTKALEDPLLAYDGIGLAALVKSGEVSPRELVEASIRRIESVDGDVNAVVTPTFERALERADKLSREGPLAGVPTLLKDNTDFTDVRTTQGSAFFKDHVAPDTAPLAAAFENAGLNILGKTNMPEFGLIPSTESTLFGACRNPWDLARSVGGSSGGSAAAVAAGYVPLAHATDGGGSIRIPASCGGVFGLKPSRRRMVAGASDQTTFMVDHCVSRSVRDSALVFTLAQDTSPSSALLPVPFITRPAKRRLKIGLSLTSYLRKMLHDDVRASIEDTAVLCESLGHTVEEASNPINGEEFEQHFFAIFSSRLISLIDHIEDVTGLPIPESQLVEKFTYDFALHGRTLPDDAVPQAMQYMAALEHQMVDWMDKFDVLLTPVLTTPPPEIGTLFDSTADYDTMARRIFDYLPYTPIQNALGTPAMSVPLGMSEDNLPIGSQFIGRQGDEQTLFEFAYELEQAKPWASHWAPCSAAHA